MLDQRLTAEKEISVENSTEVAKGENGSAARSMQGKRWLSGAGWMAICCGAPLLLLAAVSLFGLSLGAIASGALSLAALLACPVGMYFMMRSMSKK